MDIQYLEIDEKIEEKIIQQYGSWVHDYNCFVRGENCCLIAALDGGNIAGFAALHPAKWIPPLDDKEDAFIEVIEVAKAYRRQGIGSHLVKLMEDYAASKGFRQIRSWSSEDKVEALNMWYKLGFCMCPAAQLGPSVKLGFENQQIVGYYYGKLL